MNVLTLVHSAPPAPRPGFRSHDLIALACWVRRADAHGYRRTLLEDGTSDGEPEEGAYVLIYPPSSDWASWGVLRDGAEIVVWHCGTGADLGRFASMLQALESLPPVRPVRTRPAVPASRNFEMAVPPGPRLTLVHHADRGASLGG